MGVSKTAERWLGDGQGTGTQALFLEDVNVSPSSPPLCAHTPKLMLQSAEAPSLSPSPFPFVSLLPAYHNTKQKRIFKRHFLVLIRFGETSLHAASPVNTMFDI